MPNPPPRGDPLDEHESPAPRAVRVWARANPGEVAAGVDHLYAYASRPPPQLDPQAFVGSDARVTHRVGDQLGDQQKDVVTHGGGQLAVGCGHGASRGPAGFGPSG
jgi:hypothetical protein